MSRPKPSNSELIAAYLDAVLRKDASVIEHFFAPDVEYMVNGTQLPDKAGVLPPISAECYAALPWLGMHRGREDVKRFLEHLHRNLEVTAYGPREVIPREIELQFSDGFSCMLFPQGERSTFPTRSDLSCETA